MPILGTITIALFKKAAVEVAVTAEASRTEAVEPAGADEEVDEIGRPLRPSRRQPNLHVELPVVVVQPQSDVTLYKVAGDECGQVTFEKTNQL